MVPARSYMTDLPGESRDQVVSRLVVISGGQSGVDRAALDEAISRGIPFSGWCPLGGWAEDMPNPPGVRSSYPLLRETPLADPAQRTEWNVRDSDACLIVVDAGGTEVSRGTALAEQLAARYGKPLLVIDPGERNAVAKTQAWLMTLLASHDGASPLRLAIGGPRESEAKGIYRKSRLFLGEVLAGA
jgi:putative molybdenum carrier protein